jgi:hypothetical protein
MAENRELALVLKLVADQFKSELKKSQGLLGDFNSFIRSWQTQLVAAGSALFAVAKSTANYGEELLKTSQKVGINVEALSGLQYAAKMADLSNESFVRGLKTLSQNMVEAAQRTGDGEALFRRLNITVTDSTGKLKPTEQVLLSVADAFEKHADGAGKSELAVKLFGKAGLELIPFLNQGKAGITDLMKEAERFGLVLSKDDAESANRFNDELKRLQAETKGLTLAVGQPLVEALLGAADIFDKVKLKVRELSQETSYVNQNLKNMSDSFGQSAIGQGLMDAFTALGFGHRKGEGTTPREQWWFDLLGGKPGSGVMASPAGSTTEPKPAFQTIADQEKLGKALLEIYLAQNRAIEIRNKLVREEANEYLLMLDRQLQLQQIDEQAQEAKGKAIVENTKVEIEIRDAAQARERDGLIANKQAWVNYFEQVGGSLEGLYEARQDLLRAELAKELNLEEGQAARLLLAWQNHDQQLADDILARTDKTLQEKETIELKYLQRAIQNKRELGGDMWEGFTEGMRKFAQDNGPFGMMQNAARQTAQAMQSSFQSLFFDFMQGKMRSLSDLFASAFRFVQQMVAQILAQMATTALIGNSFGGAAGLGGMGLAGAFGGGGGTSLFTTMDTGWWDNTKEFFGFSSAYAMNRGGMVPVQRFAFGGPVYSNNDSVPALLTPGEFVVNRRGVEALHRLNQGDLPTSGAAQRPVVVNMTVQTPDASSFRQSREQLMAELSAGMMRAARRNL